MFKLKENGTNVKREITAGITTFMTMAYILAVNPSILSDAGMDGTAVLLATCIASFIGTACIMPLFYSVSEGISFGVISYVVLNLVCGRRKEIHPVMYVLALLFILKYIFL